MDLYKAIAELYEEKQRVDRAIAALEGVDSSRHAAAIPISGRHGRKSMGAEERLQVSKRIKNYWAKRRSEGGPPKGSPKL
jgi:hypothetical protein